MKAIFAVLFVSLLVIGCAVPTPVPAPTATASATATPSLILKVSTGVPTLSGYPSILLIGKLGTMQIAKQHYKILVGQKIELGIWFEPKANGSAEIKDRLCTFQDGYVLGIHELAYGVNHTGTCIGAVRLVYHSNNQGDELFAIPVTIEVVGAGSG